jgi:cytosine/uracil/thiamine/allantoin permease
LDIMGPAALMISIFHRSENQRNKDTERESESLQVKQAQREWEWNSITLIWENMCEKHWY